jgi:hypothetical protein
MPTDRRKSALDALAGLEEDAMTGALGEALPEERRPKLILTIEQAGDVEVADAGMDDGEEMPEEEY